MRLLQTLVFVIGMTALGTGLGFAALVLAVGLLQRPGGEPWTRGFGQYIGGLVCGAPLGAITGLVASICCIRTQRGSEKWSAFVWLGIFLGMVAGVGVAFGGGFHEGFDWWGTAVFAAAFGTAGGLLARVVLAVVRRANKVE